MNAESFVAGDAPESGIPTRVVRAHGDLRRPRFSRAVIAWALLIAAQGAASTPEPLATIRVRVREAEGIPAAALVRPSRPEREMDSGREWPTAGGVAELPVPAGMPVGLRVAPEGRVPITPLDLAVVARDSTLDWIVDLPGTATLEGLVLDEAGSPVMGARVDVTARGSGWIAVADTASDSGGRFTVRGLPRDAACSSRTWVAGDAATSGWAWADVALRSDVTRVVLALTDVGIGHVDRGMPPPWPEASSSLRPVVGTAPAVVEVQSGPDSWERTSSRCVPDARQECRTFAIHGGPAVYWAHDGEGACLGEVEDVSDEPRFGCSFVPAATLDLESSQDVVLTWLPPYGSVDLLSRATPRRRRLVLPSGAWVVRPRCGDVQAIRLEPGATRRLVVPRAFTLREVRVTDARRRPVAWATLQRVHPDGVRLPPATVTGDDGRAHVEAAHAEPVLVRVSHPGHGAAEVEVPVRGAVVELPDLPR